MAARTIVTSHPDVACDVCGRRLLRGEQPDVFLGGGQRRMVCELCTTRAAHEGWRRETEAHAVRPRAERPMRGGSLLRSLRQLRWPVDRSARPVRAELELEPDAEAEARGGEGTAPASEWSTIDAEWAAVDEEWDAPGELPAAIESTGSARPPGEPAAGRAAREGIDATVMRALAVFNAGEHPRRLAGVARALGAPTVSARRLEGANVTIVVAWELCWYRYEIDSEDESRGAWLAAEGMELDELAENDRIVSAVLDERGQISALAP